MASEGPPPRPSVRLPLQVGTTSAWAAARVALALFPGLAFMALAVDLALTTHDTSGEVILLPGVLAVLLLAYAWFYVRLALRARASDLRFLDDALAIDGGAHGGRRIPWTELTAPYAKVEQATEKRLVLWRLPLAAFAAVGGDDADPEEKVQAWRLAVWHKGERVQLAETDRAIEAASMRAAVETIEAVVAGREFVEHAAAIETDFAPCPRCGAPLVPDEADTVVCAYCRHTVPMPAAAREQAKAARLLAARQRRAAQAIARLVRQPGAVAANVWLVTVALVMVGAWPLAWTSIGARVWRDGVHWIDAATFFLPIAAVVAGFFFVRGRLANRGALQILTLGFGALAPARPDEPPRCRMCHGPLPEPGLGGVVTCRYCQADNIAGIDLRPLTGKRRAEQKHFEAALARRRRERLLWLGLSVLALGAFVAWALATWSYLHHRG